MTVTSLQVHVDGYGTALGYGDGGDLGPASPLNVACGLIDQDGTQTGVFSSLSSAWVHDGSGFSIEWTVVSTNMSSLPKSVAITSKIPLHPSLSTCPLRISGGGSTQVPGDANSLQAGAFPFSGLRCDHGGSVENLRHVFNVTISPGQSVSVSCSVVECAKSDLDGSGGVDQNDLSVLLSQWGGSGNADLDGDGSVGSGDLSILLGDM